MSKTIVMENGSNVCKIGYATQLAYAAIPNCIIKSHDINSLESNKVHIASECYLLKDTSMIQSFQPFETSNNNITVNIDVELQTQIWDSILSKIKNTSTDNLDFNDTNLAYVENSFVTHEENLEELFFEHYQFQGLHRSLAGSYASLGYSIENKNYKFHNIPNSSINISLIIDAGHSACRIIPVCDFEPILSAMTIFPIGGQHLTRYLQDLLWSYPLESQHITDIKEKLCFVSSDYKSDLDIVQQKHQKLNFIRRDYILHPKYPAHLGRVLEKDEILNPSYPYATISSERFKVPEILFNSTMYDFNRANVDANRHQQIVNQLFEDGHVHTSKMPIFTDLVTAIIHSIQLCPQYIQDYLYKNIICVGGTFKIPNLAERIQLELQSRMPVMQQVRIFTSTEPTGVNWRGMAHFINTKNENFIPEYGVTRKEYEEYGKSIIKRKFIL